MRRKRIMIIMQMTIEKMTKKTRNAAIRTAIVKRSWVVCNCCRNAAETQEHRDPKRETQREAANWGSGVRPWPTEHGAMRETSHETGLEMQNAHAAIRNANAERSETRDSGHLDDGPRTTNDHTIGGGCGPRSLIIYGCFCWHASVHLAPTLLLGQRMARSA